MYTTSISLFIGRRSVINSMSEAQSGGGFGAGGGARAVLVMFSFRMSSSLTTLSMSLRLASSTTITFHCVFHEGSARAVGARGTGTNFSLGCVADRVENDCARGSAGCWADRSRAGLSLTLALRVNNGDAHGGRRWAEAALRRELTGGAGAVARGWSSCRGSGGMLFGQRTRLFGGQGRGLGGAAQAQGR